MLGITQPFDIKFAFFSWKAKMSKKKDSQTNEGGEKHSLIKANVRIM